MQSTQVKSDVHMNQVSASTIQQEGEPLLGLRVVTGGQGILRRISGPALPTAVAPTPALSEPEAAPAAAERDRDQPLSATESDASQAELEEAIDKLVGQEILSFQVINVMSTNAIGGTLSAQHTYLKKLMTIHAIDVATARARNKFNPQRLRTAKRVQHPNLHNILHYATHHRFILVFTDRQQGVSLAEILERQAPMLESRALAIVQGVCEGLAALQNSQFTHGGICPEHIFIGTDGQAKLIDYCWHLYVPEGGADPFQCHHSVYGSVARWTRAPETLIDAGDKAEIDHRADIYALGATLHYMVTGQRPFPAISDPHLRNAQSQASLKLPHQLNPSLSRETSAMVTAMIEPNPNRRPSHYGELIELLQSKQQGQRGKPSRRKRSKTQG